MRRISLLFVLALSSQVTLISAAEFKLNGHTFTLPDGFEIELAARLPLVDRPITASFDEQGRLYVTDSSGSNDPVKKQLEDKPHRIAAAGRHRRRRRVRQDHRVRRPVDVPRRGAVATTVRCTSPRRRSIWKFTDTDGDGVADQREEWFEGKTLTGCANDLHGPYLGPDGWIYWCKGAFAEQEYTIHGKPFKTQASHIFRCRPDGTGFEPVMTGGMDNPVDVVFHPDGERIFTTTFLSASRQRQARRPDPRHLRRRLRQGARTSANGHPRTGELMPVLTHLGAAAPCGLTRYEATVFGDDYRDNLFACQFNMHKVSRHVLDAEGARRTNRTTAISSSATTSISTRPTCWKTPTAAC